MADDSTTPDNPVANDAECEDDELEDSRKSGLEMVDALIRVYYTQAIETAQQNFKPGDLIRMIDLRHKLSPTTAEQIKFWRHLTTVRRNYLKKVEREEQLKKNKEAQK